MDDADDVVEFASEFHHFPCGNLHFVVHGVHEPECGREEVRHRI